MVDVELRRAFDSIESQWNAAEEYVKRVERLRRGLVVGASINELRYAGRRIVEAYACGKDAPPGSEGYTRSLELLGEVKHFCLRAQHDAMDAAVTYIDVALAKLESEFGCDLLHERFPSYLSMKRSLKEISDVMAQSRGDRTKRDVLYAGIRDDLVPTLIEQHFELENSHVVLSAVYNKRVKAEKRETVRFWLTLFVAVVTAVAAVWAIYPIVFPKQ